MGKGIVANLTKFLRQEREEILGMEGERIILFLKEEGRKERKNKNIQSI